MTALKNLVVGIGILLLLVFILGFALPSEYRVERSIVIDAPPQKVFEHIHDLRDWRAWGVWFKRDPDMTVTYSGPEKSVGRMSKWESESEGSGEMKVLAITPNQNIKYSLYFPDFDMGSTGELVLEEKDGKSVVTWMSYGDVGSNPIDHYFAVFMDSLIGPDFEAGLDNLKVLVEAQG